VRSGVGVIPSNVSTGQVSRAGAWLEADGSSVKGLDKGILRSGDRVIPSDVSTRKASGVGVGVGAGSGAGTAAGLEADLEADVLVVADDRKNLSCAAGQSLVPVITKKVWPDIFIYIFFLDENRGGVRKLQLTLQ
jgi:hypothetical protein